MPADHADAHKGPPVWLGPLHQQIKRANGGHREAAGYHRADHVVRILPEQPGVQQQRPKARQQNLAVRSQRVADRMLHPGVRRHDEESGKPRSQEDQEAREPVPSGSQLLFAEEKQTQETRLQEERKHALHRQRLADNAAGGLRKARPIGAELEFHGDAGDHAHGEVDGEDSRPEARRAIVVFVARAQRQRLQHYQQQRQSHGQLRKDVVEGDGESEMQPVDGQGIHFEDRSCCGLLPSCSHTARRLLLSADGCCPPAARAKISACAFPDRGLPPVKDLS